MRKRLAREKVTVLVPSGSRNLCLVLAVVSTKTRDSQQCFSTELTLIYSKKNNDIRNKRSGVLSSILQN